MWYTPGIGLKVENEIVWTVVIGIFALMKISFDKQFLYSQFISSHAAHEPHGEVHLN